MLVTAQKTINNDQMSIESADQANLVNRAMSAFRWVAALRFMGQMVSWLSTIFVIRFLAPEDYGVITLAEVFRTFLVLFSTVGLSQALIKVEHLTGPLIQKTLGLLVVINVCLFLVQFSIAPYAAAFYENEDLEMVLKVLAFTYLIIPWTSVPSSLVARNLQHKKTSKITFFTDVLGSCLSLTLAYLGYGYWALVAAVLFTFTFNCIFFNFIIEYPKLPRFSLKGTEELFKFGAFVALSEVLFVAYNRVDAVIVGKFFEIAEVGFYGVAIQLSTMLMTKTVPLFNVVALPTFARMSSTEGDSNEYLVKTLRFASVLVFPVFFGAAMVGEDLIPLVLSGGWSEVAIIFAILVVSVPFRILAYIISPALLAAGGARINMTNALLTFIALTIGIFLLLPYGLEGVAVAWSLTSICVFGLAVVRGGRYLSLPVMHCLRSFTPAFLVSVIMCIGIYLVDRQFTQMDGFLALYKIPLGGVIYLGAFWLLFRSNLEEIIHVGLRLAGRR